MRRAMGHARCTLSCLRGAEAYSARRLRAGGREEKRLSNPGTAIPDDARPRLPRGVRLVHNEAQGGWVLLAPERVFKADAIAAEIVKRCTGEASFGEIVDDLVKTYSAPREKILADVSALLRGLADKRVLQGHLSGGEPGGRRGLVDITAAAHAAGLYTNLITSAVGITDKSLGALG